MMARLILTIPMLMLPLAAMAQSGGGNPQAGRNTAATLCAPCHQVDAMRRDGAPGFRISPRCRRPRALSLKVFLRSSHDKMPNLIIPGPEVDDLIAYILSLKPAPDRR